MIAELDEYVSGLFESGHAAPTPAHADVNKVEALEMAADVINNASAADVSEILLTGNPGEEESRLLVKRLGQLSVGHHPA